MIFIVGFAINILLALINLTIILDGAGSWLPVAAMIFNGLAAGIVLGAALST